MSTFRVATRGAWTKGCRGSRSAGSSRSSSASLRDARTLNRVLRRKGYKRDALWYLEAQGNKHQEADWAWRLPQALEFLLSSHS
jgi:hypothetical protein